MKKINDGGPAFPSTTKTYAADNGDQMHMGANGMTLRDYFAAKTMASYLMPAGDGQTWARREDFNYLAETAYMAADAMLRAREAS